jgi:hypothetical protein
MHILSLIELVRAQEQKAQTNFSYEDLITPLVTRPATEPAQYEDKSQLGDTVSETASVTSSLRSTQNATRDITVLSSKLFTLLENVIYPDDVLPIRIMCFGMANKKKSAFYVVTSELREYMSFYKDALSPEDYKVIKEEINKPESKYTLHTPKMVMVGIPEDPEDCIPDESPKAAQVPSAPVMVPSVSSPQPQTVQSH